MSISNIDRSFRFSRRHGLIVAAACAAAWQLKDSSSSFSADLDYPGNTDWPYVVDAAWVKERINQDLDLVLLDLQSLRAYRRSHLPNAIHCWWQDTMELNNPVYGTVLMEVDDQQQRIDFLNHHGIGPGTTVVAYDADRGRWAARLVWFLRFLGQSRVSMLMGGASDWIGSEFEMESDTHEPHKRNDAVVSPQPEGYVITPQLIDRLQLLNAVLVDCRSETERIDTANNTLPLGQIPGSIWYPWTNALADDNGDLLTASELAMQFSALGIEHEHDVYLYARYGVETAHTWMVLKLLGYPNVTIYDRGWAGWSSQQNLPTSPLPQ